MRKVAEEFLPGYIAWRYKVPFANGAGMNVGFNFKTQDGDVAKAVLSAGTIKEDEEVKKKYGFFTKEELAYFEKYKKFKFDKLCNNWQRIITKETLTTIDEKANEFRMLVAEFGRLPLYFPIYLAAQLGNYKKHKLDIDFISSGGDDLTYNSLLSGSAQIGIADPIFTFSKNFATKGKIIGQLIGKAAIAAATLDPNIKIDKLDDLKKYKVGTFQEFSTTNTLMKKLLPEIKFIPVKYNEITKALKERVIDIGIMTEDFACELVGKGGHIVYNFNESFVEYLFTGITICDNLDPKFYPAINSYISSIKETINFIKKNKKEAFLYFKKEFPLLLNHEETFNHISKYWSKKLDVSNKAIENAKGVWQNVYPWLLKASVPQFIKPTIADGALKIFNSRNISRDIPYREDGIAHIINTAAEKNEPIKIIGFWGASAKEKMDESDAIAIEKFKKINQEIRKIYKNGVEFIFIFADEHARLNGYSKNKYSNYLKEIDKKINEKGFKSLYLSSIWKKYKLNDKIIIAELKKLKESDWRDVKCRKELEKSTRNLGFEKYKDEAKRYFVMRKLESQILKKEFSDMIFHTYSSDIFQDLFPDAPTFYFWVRKEGHASVPWFTKCDAKQDDEIRDDV